MRNTNLSWFSVLALCVLGYATIPLIGPPSPKPINAPETVFSAMRARQDLAAITQDPPPMRNSQAPAEVQDYLVYEIRLLGLEPQVQKSFEVRVVHPGWVIVGQMRTPGEFYQTNPTDFAAINRDFTI